jgi:hypothetical protein
VSRGRVAWQGGNPAAKPYGAGIRLYLTTWANPHPKKKVVRIDISSTNTTAASPFCVAMPADGG